MKCPRCQQENPSHAKFCLECGAPFKGSHENASRAVSHADLQRALAEALDQQTATSQILELIGSSPTDAQPVFQGIVESAKRLCGGQFGVVYRYDGDLLHLAAHHGIAGEALEHLRRRYPQAARGRGSVPTAVRERRIVLVSDYESDPTVPEEVREGARLRGSRSSIAVPMLRGNSCVGCVIVGKALPGHFPDEQIALLKIFADQAVIAIENVRLFNETREALEQQTATSEILRVISRSPSNLQPVLDAIAAHAALVCDAYDTVVFLREGDRVRYAAHYGPINITAQHAALSRRSITETAILDRQPVHVHDVLAAEQTFPLTAQAAREGGFRTVLSVPLLRENEAIGALTIRRQEVQPFAPQQIELLKTFADQAVIAIENVRLFNELQERTKQLGRSVEQLTALGEVGRAVSSTLDLQTVLATIVSRAVQLAGMDGGVVFEYDEHAEEFIHRAATEGGGTLAEQRRATRVRKGEGVVGRTAETLEPAQVPDIRVPGAYESRLRENLIESGVRALLAVPMVSDDRLTGCLVVSRNVPGEFPGETIELLRTFATQSALAIQNARLFREIEDKSRQLEIASQHKSEFLANMSHELRTPLNAIIGFSEVLSERMFGELNEKQEEYLRDIHASGQHLLSLINDILDLSKIEAGRMELELTEFHLPTALDNAMTLVRERAGRRGITLQADVDERLGQIRADERKIRQVVLNLLSNAIKFTPEGGRIDVRAVPKDGTVEVLVSDTGVGIAPEDQEAIFEEFKQVGTAAKKVEGTGLGLALSRKFIELHGGRIWVKSEPGVGSTFTFSIPARTGP